jgi:hypothetical protein
MVAKDRADHLVLRQNLIAVDVKVGAGDDLSAAGQPGVIAAQSSLSSRVAAAEADRSIIKIEIVGCRWGLYLPGTHRCRDCGRVQPAAVTPTIVSGWLGRYVRFAAFEYAT